MRTFAGGRLPRGDPLLYKGHRYGWRQRGRLLQSRGHLESTGRVRQGIADFNEALRLDPKDAHAYNDLGVSWLRKGQFDKAIADYSQGAGRRSRLCQGVQYRGFARGVKGEYDGALADVNEALRLNHRLAGAYNNRGLAWHMKGEYDKAIADFSESLD